MHPFYAFRSADHLSILVRLQLALLTSDMASMTSGTDLLRMELEKTVSSRHEFLTSRKIASLRVGSRETDTQDSFGMAIRSESNRREDNDSK